MSAGFALSLRHDASPNRSMRRDRHELPGIVDEHSDLLGEYLTSEDAVRLSVFDNHIDIVAFTAHEIQELHTRKVQGTLSDATCANVLAPSRAIIHPGSILGVSLVLGFVEKAQVFLPPSLKPFREVLLARTRRRLAPVGATITEDRLEVYGHSVDLRWDLPNYDVCCETHTEICCDYFFDYRQGCIDSDLYSEFLHYECRASPTRFVRSCLNGFLPPALHSLAEDLVQGSPLPSAASSTCKQSMALSDVIRLFRMMSSNHPDFSVRMPFASAPDQVLAYLVHLHLNGARQLHPEEFSCAAAEACDDTRHLQSLYLHSRGEFSAAIAVGSALIQDRPNEATALQIVDSLAKQPAMNPVATLDAIEGTAGLSSRYARVAAKLCLNRGIINRLSKYVDCILDDFPNDHEFRNIGRLLS